MNAATTAELSPIEKALIEENNSLRARERELLDAAFNLIVSTANAVAVASVFSLSQAKGLVEAHEWPEYRDRFHNDPDGLRRALHPEPDPAE
jgi:hypothetical protein